MECTVTIDETIADRGDGMLAGALIADALAMPGHWYYDREALRRDYGELADFRDPLPFHPDSILWRSHYEAQNGRGDILHGRAKYWGQRGVHYHQGLKAGENTLNFQLLRVLDESLRECGRYDLDDWLERYTAFMLSAESHGDTYVEEYHRHFFSVYARGNKPRRCGGSDVHIGGLVPVPLLVARLGDDPEAAMAAVKEHVGFSHGDPDVMEAATAFARMLLGVRGGEGLREEILRHGSRWVSARKLAGWLQEPDLTVVGRRLSPACYIKDAFAASLYFAWKYADDFSGAVTANAMAGGDNCHRGAVVGALCGGAAGAAQLPEALLTGLRGRW